MNTLIEIELSHLNSMGMKPGHQIKLKKMIGDYKNSMKIRVSDSNFVCNDGESIKSENSSYNGTKSNGFDGVKLNK